MTRGSSAARGEVRYINSGRDDAFPSEHTLASRVSPDPAPLLARPRRHSSATLLQVVPDRLAVPLRRAHAVEHLARGPERWAAFRLTRLMIAGARITGYTDAAVAECVGISLQAVRSRGGSDGWIDAEKFAALTGLDVSVIDQWAADGLLRLTATDDDGRHHYAASELITALSRFDDPTESQT
jgi:hypothetical protein